MFGIGVMYNLLGMVLSLLNRLLWFEWPLLGTVVLIAHSSTFLSHLIVLIWTLQRCFSIFPLTLSFDPFWGVHFTLFHANFNPSGPSWLWERWERLFRGLKASTFNSVQFYYWAKESCARWLVVRHKLYVKGQDKTKLTRWSLVST